MMIHPRPQSVKNQFFDRLTEVKEAGKASNSHSSAYRDTVEGADENHPRPIFVI